MRDKLRKLAGRAGRGQMAIMLVLVTLLFLLIMIPVIEMFVRNESIWTVKERKNTIAFHLAEAGIDRAYWKLIEKEEYFQTITEGGTLAGYADDVEYTDIEGGTYKVNMTVGDTNLKVQVIATGKDATSREYRAIKAVFSKSAVDAALQAPSIAGAGNANIHWGPVMSLSAMNLAGGANELYPRKYARGAITASGIYPDRDTDPNQPNKGPYTNDIKTEWWSYNEPPGVPDILTPDTSHYASLAQAQGYYYAANESINNLKDTVCTVGTDPKVRFFAGDATFGGSKYFCGILIVMGQLTFNSGGAHPQGSISVMPPSDAHLEYQLNVPVHNGAQKAGSMDAWTYEAEGDHDAGLCGGGPHGNTSAKHEYPGDFGGDNDKVCYNFRCGSDVNCDGDCNDGVDEGELGGFASGKQLSFKGYVYAASGFTGGAQTRIHGAVAVANGAAFNGGGMDIFYDNTLNIRFLNNTIRRVSWHEVSPTEF